MGVLVFGVLPTHGPYVTPLPLPRPQRPFLYVCVCVGLLAASPEIRAGNWKDGFPKVYHALDNLLVSGEGQAKAGGWGGSSRVDGVGVGCTIVTALLDRKRGQASKNVVYFHASPFSCRAFHVWDELNVSSCVSVVYVVVIRPQ